MFDMHNRVAIKLWLRQLNFQAILLTRPAFRPALLELFNQLLESFCFAFLHQLDSWYFLVLFYFQDHLGLLRTENLFKWSIKDDHRVQLVFHNVEEPRLTVKFKCFIDREMDHACNDTALNEIQKQSGERLWSTQILLLCKVVREPIGTRIDEKGGWYVVLYWEKSSYRHDEDVEWGETLGAEDWVSFHIGKRIDLHEGLNLMQRKYYHWIKSDIIRLRAWEAHKDG